MMRPAHFIDGSANDRASIFLFVLIRQITAAVLLLMVEVTVVADGNNDYLDYSTTSISATMTTQIIAVHELRAPNGSELVLGCAPAERLVRTHMAPDFESPQLVRKLDWFHEETLVATYQQVGVCISPN